jgi:hypothetical protein
MGERRCRYCQRVFQPSKFQPRQAVCGGAEWQRKRRTDYHRNKIASDPEYREVCRDSPRKVARSQPRLPEKLESICRDDFSRYGFVFLKGFLDARETAAIRMAVESLRLSPSHSACMPQLRRWRRAIRYSSG